MDRNDILVLVTSMLMLVWLWQLWERWESSQGRSKPSSSVRQLPARTSEDCQQCCEAHADVCEHVVAERPTPKPWPEVKSPRGRKKEIKSEGHACSNEACEYYGILDEGVHALVGYGRQGKCEPIQYFFCQACQSKVTERWGTYRLKTRTGRVREVLTALGDGLDVSAAVRVFGHAEGTVRRWSARAGEHSRRLHDKHLMEVKKIVGQSAPM